MRTGPTSEFLKYYAGRAGETNVLLLVVSRSDVADATRFLPVIAELRRRRSVHALDVEPLTAAEMQSFLRTALGTQSLPHDDLLAVTGMRRCAGGDRSRSGRTAARRTGSDGGTRKSRVDVRVAR
jgi:hypothetical protein